MFTRKIYQILMAIFLICPSLFAAKQTLIFEPGMSYQSRNDQAIPGQNIGTRFSLADVNQGPFATARIYYSYLTEENTEWRLLLAPLTLALEGQLSQNTLFQNSIFSSQVPTQFLYKFNSYRLTWAKHYKSQDHWSWAIGLTGKIRDAEVRLSQDQLVESKTDLGFVPLLHLQAFYQNPELPWGFKFDFDGLASPQGRAFDILMALNFQATETYEWYIGYRTIEGGADNKVVYNFAWFNNLVLGVSGKF